MDRKDINYYRKLIRKNDDDFQKLITYSIDDSIKQAIREEKMYTIEELTNIVNFGFDDDDHKLTNDKIIAKGTISNTLKQIENGSNSKFANIFIPKELKNDNPLKTSYKAMKRGRPKKLYSYGYILYLESIFKNKSRKSFNQVINEAINKSTFSKLELDKLIKDTLGEETCNQINPYNINDLETAILNRQNRLKKTVVGLVNEYRKIIDLRDYLFDVENTDEYVDCLEYIINLFHQNKIYKSDVVRLATMLTNTPPKEVITYSDKLSNNNY